MNKSDFSFYITSFLFHVIFLMLAFFVIKPTVEKPLKQKFDVLLYHEPKSQVLGQKRPSGLTAQDKSSGAAKLAKDKEIEAVKEGLEKGVPITTKERMTASAGTGRTGYNMRRQKAEGRRQEAGIKEQNLKSKSQKFEEKISQSNDGIKIEKKETENKGIDEEAMDSGKSEEKTGGGSIASVGEMGDGRKTGFSPRNIDRDLLAKYAGKFGKDGLGGEDEDGEGGIDKVGGAGKVLDLNTSDLKYISYFKHIKDLIENVWVYPREAREKGIDGRLVIKFTIKENGDLGDVEVLNSSGHKFLDAAAVTALKDASPFPELPKQWKKKDLTIAGNFIYYLTRGGIFY
ncbi:MAG: hypothetical protein A2W05_09670 [Candidatus Schekmanbacteria bacterium RBG_16_38_10]|uniref:TonB C-terminal domain-containing protein n=1 Tax=Candidatus Schekmanbacteria bacterium RBG_16_38_10 TaxID=1817879 RepID=A0A1F7RYJ7_9BACT|nr:MAG: hypothetical protein A2W05_09670 [Candidatus Schekmanbacteria bacterium RBG_16_38_10]